MTFTVEILNEHAINLLRELEQMQVIRLYQINGGSRSKSKKKEFKAIKLDTTGFRFNREEANER